jgi:heme oxygenase
MDLDRLRLETTPDHASVEQSVPLMDKGLTRATYVSCLKKLHGLIAAWEEWAALNAPVGLQPFLATRRRLQLLQLDLKWFGADCGDERPTLPEMPDTAAVLGAMYVMEGSTLGGQLIARHVEQVLGLMPGRGNAYFRGHQERTGNLWKELCELLRTNVPDSETDAAIVGARAMFRAFGTWMHIVPE